MKNYELALIVSSELTSQEIEKKLENLRKEISKCAKITSEDVWGLRDLAYRIKLQEKGFYAIFYVEGEAGCLDEIEGELRIDPQFLRYLVIKREDGYVPQVRLEEEGAPVKKEEIKKKVEVARAQKVVKIEEEKPAPKVKKVEEKKVEVKEEVVEEKKVEEEKVEEEKEEVKKEVAPEKVEVEEKKEEEEKEPTMKKKVAPKKKSSLDDLDAALDELLKD